MTDSSLTCVCIPSYSTLFFWIGNPCHLIFLYEQRFHKSPKTELKLFLVFIIKNNQMETFFFEPEIMGRLYDCSMRTDEEWAAFAKPNILIGLLYSGAGAIYFVSFFWSQNVGMERNEYGMLISENIMLQVTTVLLQRFALQESFWRTFWIFR